jgi:pimeloyl-ACP methyl ester carboxylesterase
MRERALRLLAGTLALGALLAGCGGPRVRLREARASAAPAALEALCAEVAGDPLGPSTQRALGDLISAWAARRPASPEPCGGRVTIEAAGPGGFALEDFEALAPAEALALEGLTRHQRVGAGAALVGLRHNRAASPLERHFPPEAIVRAVTALAVPEAGVDGAPRARVRLLSPLYHEEVQLTGRRVPLAADFTAPFAALLVRAGELRASWLSGLVDEEPARGARLYLMEPYDPRKTPLLMVHGLASTPLTWAKLTNEIWGHPELRRRYQVWHFHYPTSAPFLYSAYLLRRELDDVRELLAASGEAEAPPLVVLGHSMGGLLAKTLITDSGDAVWKTVFTAPPQALRGASEDVATVQAILHWRARPHVGRVLFIAVPHRGSALAARGLGRVGDALAGVPSEFAALYARIDAENPAALTPAFAAALSRGELSSIDTLSPRHPLLPVLNALPFAGAARVASIIGDQGADGPLVESSDGVVAYASSHLDGVPEIIVPTGHSALADSATIAAIQELLLQP